MDATNHLLCIFSRLMFVSEEEIKEIFSAFTKEERFPFIFDDKTVKKNDSFDIFQLILFIKEIISSKGFPMKKKFQLFGQNYFHCDVAVSWMSKSDFIPDFAKTPLHCTAMGQLLKLIGKIKKKLKFQVFAKI
jgi:hypothetical protein